MLDVIDSFIYSNIINNIFTNLEDYLKENNLVSEQISQIKNEYEDDLEEINKALNIKSNKVNKHYYNSIKSDFEKISEYQNFY